jgi:hypothetical protein
MNKLVILLVRVALGLAGGWLLMHFFFRRGGWTVALILAALVVLSAYASELWRIRKKK